ncbi:MAG: ATP-binding protein [Aliivibrio sp.]|uniref:ATP-binding protein n=1 Tax=Aliivibrio sp. TaxID=1872443 RepID=UPI001A4F7C82|nr:ATP-binding protein [Aliivibrio sp.]
MTVFLLGEESRLIFEWTENEGNGDFFTKTNCISTGCELIAEFINTHLDSDNSICELRPFINTEPNTTPINTSIITTRTAVKNRNQKSSGPMQLVSSDNDRFQIEEKEINRTQCSPKILATDQDILVLFGCERVINGKAKELLDIQKISSQVTQLTDAEHKFGIVLVFLPLEIIRDNSDFIRKICELGKESLLITDIVQLRKSQRVISKGISWERTFYDLQKVFKFGKVDPFTKTKKGTRNTNVADCFSNVVIRIGYEGALFFRNDDEEREKSDSVQFFFDPQSYEGELEAKLEGRVHCSSEVFCGSIILSLLENGYEIDELMIKRAIVAIKRNYVNGYKKVGQKVSGSDPFVVFDRKYLLERGVNTIKVNRLGLGSDKVQDNVSEADLKTRAFHELNHVSMTAGVENNAKDIAKAIVRKGIDATVGSGLCRAKFGNLLTVDRNEIENLRSVFRRIVEFVKDRNSNKPLSIAVFGPPGCGKSFSVKQLISEIRKIFPNVISENFHEMNVAQLDSISELASSLQGVRNDVIGNKIPVVFLDEFDSDGPSGKGKWLKYFLAPMQDGEFRDENSSHDLGKVIFVFAGGTKESLADFSDIPLDSTEEGEYRKNKVPDFASRLSGFIDIIGPNKKINTSKNPQQDVVYYIRRAILLRSILERSNNQLFTGKNLNIDKGVLRAFLMVDKYKHGARSLEAIVSMSNLSNKNKFERSHLPPEHLLELHVAAEGFLKLLDTEDSVL